jgi:hypothetical protein
MRYPAPTTAREILTPEWLTEALSIRYPGVVVSAVNVVAVQPGVLDWQIVMRSTWALDVAYHLSTILTVEDREASEKELLRYFLDRLRAYGAEPPAWEEAWLQYRVHMIYGYFQWAMTRWVKPPTIIYEFVRKIGLALASLESYELLGV